MLSLLLLSLAICASAYPTLDGHSFGLKENEVEHFEYDRNDVYALLGPDNLLCLNLTSPDRVKVFFGACGKDVAMEKMATGFWSITRDEINEAIMVSRVSHSCKSSLLTLTVQGLGKTITEGHFEWFQCYNQITKSVPTAADPAITETAELKPVPETWIDITFDVPFHLENKESVTSKIDMRRALDAVDLDSNYTMCFATTGDMERVTLEFQACKDSEKFVIEDMYNGTTSSLPSKIRAELLKSRSVCPEVIKNREFYMTIRTPHVEPINGNVAIYLCQMTSGPDVAYDDQVFSSAVQLQGFETTIYFNITGGIHATYSADVKFLLDVIYFADGLRVFGIDINTTEPIQVIASRCSDPVEGERIVLIGKHESGKMYLPLNAITSLQDLMKANKCSAQESDEVFYIHIRAVEEPAMGYIKFFKHTPQNVKQLESKPEQSEQREWQPARKSRRSHAQKKMSRLLARLYYNMPFNLGQLDSIVRRMPLAFMFHDSQITGGLPLAFTLNSTGSISMYVSRCRYSPRQAIAVNIKYGFHQISQEVQTAVQKLLKEPQCKHSEGMSTGDMFLHLEGTGEAVYGIIQMGVMRTKEALPAPFHEKNHSDPLYALDRWDRVNISINNVIRSPTIEFDIYNLVELAYADLYYDFHMKVPTKKIGHVVISRWANSTQGGLRIRLSESSTRTFSRQEIIALRELMTSSRGDNIGRYGLFVHVEDPEFEGVVSFWLKNFIDESTSEPHHFVTKGNLAYAVGKQLIDLESTVILKISNTQKNPVKFYATMCPGQWKLYLLSDQKTSKMQQLEIKPEVVQLVQRRSSVACPGHTEDMFFIMVVSEFAEGQLNVLAIDGNGVDQNGKYIHNIIELDHVKV